MITETKILSFERVNEEITERIKGRTYVDDKKTFFIFKRAFDITVSLFITIFFLSWLIPIIALVIKLDSKGPIFFFQRRVGLGGRSFLCFKFRTMILNSDANQKQAQENDYRITRVGNFLRKTNLDEFPQFLNVLIGQMSIVGPRPHMFADCNKFSAVVPGYKFRNLVKPGITGLAQINGFRGPTKDFHSIFRRYQYDAFYVRNSNFWLDMRIIRKTAVQTFIHFIARFDKQPAENSTSFRKFALALRSFLS